MNTFTLLAASAAALALGACAESTDVDEPVATDTADTAADQTVNSDDPSLVGDVPEVLQSDARFSTLVSAIMAAEMGEALQGEGPYTVFAPSNDAFEKLPSGTVEQLTGGETERLRNILAHHVVEGRIDAATLTQAVEQAGANGYTINTMGGGTLTARKVGAGIQINDATGKTATVVNPDLIAANGLVHEIDAVLMSS